MTLPDDRPFTPRSALDSGVTRTELERLLRSGRIRRVLRGVYADAALADSTQVRAAAVELVAPAAAVVADRTAAWIHGTSVIRGGGSVELPPVEVARDPRRRRLVERDVMRIGGISVTTPLRTALDLGRSLSPDRAVAALDSLLRTGSFTHVQLLAELPRMSGLPHADQLRGLAAFADARATSAAESVLRLRWCEAQLPTPTPRLRLSCPGGWVHLSLGLHDQRFGAVLTGQISGDQGDHLAERGWRILVLTEQHVVGADAVLLQEHLVREYHQHLLAQVG